VLNHRNWLATATAVAAFTLTACGGGGNSAGTASVRLVNATLTHSSLSLLANSAIVVPATPVDTVSAYVGVTAGSPALQINDATTSAALVTLAPSLGGGGHYVLVTYESGSSLRNTIINEDVAAPAVGTASVRIFDAATDAGGIDVFITDPAVDLATLTTPTVSFGSSTALQTSSSLSLAPGTYRIRVTGAGNTSDLRLDILSVTIANQEVGSIMLTPTIGGTLVNGSVIAQQADYLAARNTNARVRLAAAVTNGATVSASAGATPIGAGVSPSVSAYALVPAASVLNVSVNAASVGAPATALVAGSDSTLFIYGAASAASARLIIDDNHLPTTTTNLKLRLVNGLTGAGATPLTMDAAFAVIASNIAPGTASAYAVVASSTALRVDVFSTSVLAPIYSDPALSLPGNAVYTLFMLGDASAPIPLLRKDR